MHKRPAMHEWGTRGGERQKRASLPRAKLQSASGEPHFSRMDFDDPSTVSVAAFTPDGDAWDAPSFSLVERAGDELPRVRVSDGDAVWTACDVTPPPDAPPGWTDAVEGVLLGRLRGGALTATRVAGGGVRAALTWPASDAAPAGVKLKTVLDFSPSPDGGRSDRRAMLTVALTAADAAGRAAAELARQCGDLAAKAAAADARVTAMGEARDHDEADLFLRFSKVLNTKKAKAAEWRARAEAAEAQLAARGAAPPGGGESAGVPPSPALDSPSGDSGEDAGDGVGPTATGVDGVPPTAEGGGGVEETEPVDGDLFDDNDSAGHHDDTDTEDDEAMMA